MTVMCFCPFIEYKNQCLGKITMQKYTSTDATPEMFTKVSFVWNMLIVISMCMLNFVTDSRNPDMISQLSLELNLLA